MVRGTIYIITAKKTDKVYIGSTCWSLCRRLNEHESYFKSEINMGSKVQIAEGKGNYDIKPLQKIIFTTEQNLKILEQFWMDKDEYKNKLSNIIRAHNTPEYIKEYKKLHHEKNREEIAKKAAKNYKENKEEIALKRKEKEKITCECGVSITRENIQRHKTNKTHIDCMNKINNTAEEVTEDTKKKNKERALKRKEKTTCKCGVSIRIDDISRHKKSKTHIDSMNKINNTAEVVTKENKEETLKRKEKITCECGVSITRAAISRHKKNKIHIDNMKALKDKTHT